MLLKLRTRSERCNLWVGNAFSRITKAPNQTELTSILSRNETHREHFNRLGLLDTLLGKIYLLHVHQRRTRRYLIWNCSGPLAGSSAYPSASMETALSSRKLRFCNNLCNATLPCQRIFFIRHQQVVKAANKATLSINYWSHFFKFRPVTPPPANLSWRVVESMNFWHVEY